MTRRAVPAGHPAAGFTLIEVLVALFVAIVGIMGVASLLQRTLDASGEALDAAAAESVLRDRAESLRAVPFSRLSDGSDVVTAGAIYFQRSWRVERGTPAPGMARVEVTVRWSDVTPLLAEDANRVTGAAEGLLTDPSSLSDLPDAVRAALRERGHVRQAVLYRTRD